MRRHSYNRHKIVTSCDLRPTPDAAGRLFSLSQPCAWNAFAPRLLVSDWFRLTHPPNSHPLFPSHNILSDLIGQVIGYFWHVERNTMQHSGALASC